MPPRSVLGKSFGLVIRQHRLDAGMTQEGLARACRIHSTYMSRLERGLQSPTLKMIESLAKALKVKPHTLVKGAEDGI